MRGRRKYTRYRNPRRRARHFSRNNDEVRGRNEAPETKRTQGNTENLFREIRWSQFGAKSVGSTENGNIFFGRPRLQTPSGYVWLFLLLGHFCFLRAKAGSLPGFAGQVCFSPFSGGSFWLTLGGSIMSRVFSFLRMGRGSLVRRSAQKMGPRGGGQLPAFDGRGANFPDYDRQAHLRMWAYSRFKCSLLELARAELSARVATSAPHAAGRLAWNYRLRRAAIFSGHGDGGAKILDILRSYPSPEAAGAIRQQVVMTPAGAIGQLRLGDSPAGPSTSNWRNMPFSAGRPDPRWEIGRVSQGNLR